MSLHIAAYLRCKEIDNNRCFAVLHLLHKVLLALDLVDLR